MKFMTPELLARVRSQDDEVAEAAADQWEAMCADYQKHLQNIKGDFPRNLWNRLQRLDLHDAKVLTMAADEAPHFSIFLQTQDSPDPAMRYVELRYGLVGGLKHSLKVERHPNLATDGTPLGWWLYDEIDIVQGPGPVKTFMHSILFTGGFELQIFFCNLSLRHPRLLFPSSIEAARGVELQLELLGA